MKAAVLRTPGEGLRLEEAELDLPRVIGLYHAGRLPPETLIGRLHPLAGIQSAYDALATGAAEQAVIFPAGTRTADRSDGS
jgi:hypothetical protein